MSPPIVADTGGLLRGLASTRDGRPSFPEYEKVLTSTSLVIVPGLVLAEVDYVLRENRVAMRELVAEIFDPATRYEYELPLPSDIVRALELDARFGKLNLGLVDGTVVAVAERTARLPSADHGSPRLRRDPSRSASYPGARAAAMTAAELKSNSMLTVNSSRCGLARSSSVTPTQ